MEKLEKKYQLWQYNECENYTFDGFDTIEEAMLAPKYTQEWFITKRVDIEIRDTEEE